MTAKPHADPAAVQRRANKAARDVAALLATVEKLTAARDRAVDAATALEQELTVKDEALAELRALHGPKRIYDDCGHRHTTEEFDALNLVDVDPIGYVCEDGLLYVICGECCTDENGDQLAECADNHAHTDGEPVCDTARILDTPAARLSAHLFPTDGRENQ